MRYKKFYSKSKNIKYIRNCNNCHKPYTGWGKKYCSNKCAHQNHPKGKYSSSWKGNKINQESGRTRARKIYSSKPCEICRNPKIDRCHLSNDTRNNSIRYVLFLCRKHHFQLDIPIHLRVYNQPHTSSSQVHRRKSLYAILKKKRQEIGLPLGNLPRIVFPS